MFEQVLMRKKHFIIIGGDDAKIVIGTDDLNEVAEQEWFRVVTTGSSSVDEDELARVAEEAERRMAEQERRLREQEHREEQERRRALEQRRREEEQRRAEELRMQPNQQPPHPPAFARQEHPPQRQPQNLEFPFMDVTPDKMSPDIWARLSPDQQQQWQAHYNIS